MTHLGSVELLEAVQRKDDETLKYRDVAVETMYRLIELPWFKLAGLYKFQLVLLLIFVVNAPKHLQEHLKDPFQIWLLAPPTFPGGDAAPTGKCLLGS